MNNNIVAMVPVRAGSVRAPRKNIRSFDDTNLLQLKLRVLSKVSNISDICVTTDCEEAASIAKNCGANIIWRDKFYAGSDITNDEHWYHIADTSPGEIVLLAQVTSPLVKASTFEKAINQYLTQDGSDSINSVSPEQKFLWQGENPINYDKNQTPKSQNLPDIFSLNFAISLISRSTMMQRKNVVGLKPYFLKLDKVESIDVDDEFDFEVAEAVYSKRGIDWLLEK
jgi:CMP-N-acetylneuraminic acid synthetase